MDDDTLTDLIARLADARTRQAEAAQRLRTHGENIEEVRATLGNPYFYRGRPAADSESEAHYTGYKSHEPGLRLYRDLQDVSHEVEAIRNQLRDAGFDTD
jgi:hypothetical protein